MFGKVAMESANMHVEHGRQTVRRDLIEGQRRPHDCLNLFGKGPAMKLFLLDDLFLKQT